MSPEELHEAITAIQRAKLSRRAISRQGHANQKAKKLKNREEIIEAAYADAKQRNITDANEVIHPIDYLLWQEPWWVEGRDADEVWKGMSLSSTDQARFRGLDHVTRRGVHIGPLGPDRLQMLPNGAGEFEPCPERGDIGQYPSLYTWPASQHGLSSLGWWIWGHAVYSLVERPQLVDVLLRW